MSETLSLPGVNPVVHRYRLLLHETGKVKLEGSLREAIRLALTLCLGVQEEEGGFLVRRGPEFRFFHLVNRHTGQPHAVALYEPDPGSYGEKVIGSYGEGFSNYGSFHTHPNGCRALPSLTDFNRLFNGQPNNFIWSPSLVELNWFEFVKRSSAETLWRMRKVDTEGLL